jgi:hypothetical protein
MPVPGALSTIDTYIASYSALDIIYRASEAKFVRHT